MTESSADSGIFSQKPALNHSRLHFQDVTFVQRWTYYSGIDEAAVLPALTFIDVVNTTIAFQSCNFSSYQLIASHTPKPFPPLLLRVSGPFNSSTLLLYNVMTQVHPIGTSGAAQVLLPLLLLRLVT
ncbi:Hypothetical protein, putative [Bodo saltans]|uniref:Uncharacterized protein n=1 Tax=Bodo saltans TaxID=75058 RepID=A0A0S4J675_BODSA|nr:Hypothetical protein, putative [Bodo saltans]|eukprot:CUG84551.1 Hypothetical protein, putative [Bodo saltans]